MSQKSSLQFTPNGRKLKALELKNQPKMTGFLVSSPKPSFKSGKSKKPAEFSCANSEIDKEKHGRLSDSSSERKTGTNQCRKEPVVQIDSDVSEPDTPSSDSPIFPKRPVRVAKKPLVPFKVSINTVKSDDSDNSNSGSLNKKESGCHLRNPLKEKKNFSSFNINKKTEGNVTKFSSNYNEESNVSPKERKKRFHLLPADSRDSQIDIPSSSASNAPPKRKISHEDREVKRKREVPEKDTSDINASTVLSSLKSPSLATGNISNGPSANTKEVHIQKNNAKDKKGFQQNLKIGNLPLKKRIILKSALNSFNGATSHSDIARVSSKILADHEEVKQAAKAAYVETHRSLETLLDMRLDRRLCFDLKPANECNRSVLANRYHVNFGFFMQRENYEGAVGSLRCITYNHYPNKHDLHGVLYKVIEVRLF